MKLTPLHALQGIALSAALAFTMNTAHAAEPAYFSKHDSLHMPRSADRVPLVEMHKLALIQQTGYGMRLEGAGAAALVKSFKAAKP